MLTKVYKPVAPRRVSTRVLEYIHLHELVTVEDLERDLKLSPIASKVYLSRLEKEKIIKRISPGIYRIESGNLAEVELDVKVVTLMNALTERFPLSIYTVWALSMLSNYSHYSIGKDLILLEVKKDLSESIKDYLFEIGYNAILNPDKKDYEEYSTFNNPVFIEERCERYAVKGLIPTPERIWVDIYYLITRKNLNYSTHELGIILVNMLREKGINLSVMIRYAQRREIGTEIIILLYRLMRTNPKLVPKETFTRRKNALTIIGKIIEAAKNE